MGKNKISYPYDMDNECLSLCNAINKIPGLKTRESCCGHGKDSFKIWFYLSNKRKAKFLIIIGRVFDVRYGGIRGWTCLVDNTDNLNLFPCFCITSNNSIGNNAYIESQKIAENIYVHLKNKKFYNIFLKKN